MTDTQRQRIDHALQIQEQTRRDRDANPVRLVHYRPLRPRTPGLRTPR